MRFKKTKGSQVGFSMLELLIVVSIIMIVSAMAAPNVMASLRMVKLRGAASTMTNLFEQARQRAIRDNRGYVVKSQVVNGVTYWYISPNTTTALVAGVPQVALPPEISISAAPPSQANVSRAGANPNLYTIPTQNGPAFNTRGLPCYVNVGESACLNFVAPNYANFAYFLQSQGFGGTMYVAVTVESNGKIRTWKWNGASWGL